MPVRAVHVCSHEGRACRRHARAFGAAGRTAVRLASWAGGSAISSPAVVGQRALMRRARVRRVAPGRDDSRGRVAMAYPRAARRWHNAAASGRGAAPSAVRRLGLEPKGRDPIASPVWRPDQPSASAGSGRSRVGRSEPFRWISKVDRAVNALLAPATPSPAPPRGAEGVSGLAHRARSFQMEALGLPSRNVNLALNSRNRAGFTLQPHVEFRGEWFNLKRSCSGRK